MPIQIEPATALGPDLDPLVAQVDAEGHLFMRRLCDRWASGENRFDRPGEILLTARRDGQLVGIGGLNRDPYAQADNIGRLRHVYVANATRRLGVGSLLVRRLLANATPHFAVVRLRTDSPHAAAFYVRLGFHPTDEEDATHSLRLARA
jgi:GNAT superfamily N-acetyltransferase